MRRARPPPQPGGGLRKEAGKIKNENILSFSIYQRSSRSVGASSYVEALH